MPIKNDISPDVLRSFVAVAQHGSISKAAEERGLTQSAISFQIKRLEQLVGGDVFVKTPRGVGLSYLGQMVERAARRILVQNDQLIALGGRVASQETFHLGIQTVFSYKLVGNVIGQLPSWSPYGRFRFDCGNVYYLTDKLASGYLDLVFMCAPGDSRRNMLAEWHEKLTWVRGPHFVLEPGEPIPFVGREEGFI